MRFHAIALTLLCLVGPLASSGCNAIAFRHSWLRRGFVRDGMREQHIELSAGRLRYFVGGEGPPLLLLHGFGFGAVENWYKQSATFTKHHRVIAPDMFWFGQSEPRGKVDSAQAEAQALVELLDALGAKRVDIIGASYGGLVAIHLALAHPERVDRLVLVDTPGLPPNAEEQVTIAGTFEGRTRVEDLLIPTDVNQLKLFLEKVVYRKKPPFPDWVLRQVVRELQRNREAKSQLCRSLEAYPFDEAGLQRLAARTLLLWGRLDPLLLVSMGERLAKAIPGARMVVFEKAAHSAMLEDAQAFNDEVLRFLSGGDVPVPPRSAEPREAPTTAR